MLSRCGSGLEAFLYHFCLGFLPAVLLSFVLTHSRHLVFNPPIVFDCLFLLFFSSNPASLVTHFIFLRRAKSVGWAAVESVAGARCWSDIPGREDSLSFFVSMFLS